MASTKVGGMEGEDETAAEVELSSDACEYDATAGDGGRGGEMVIVRDMVDPGSVKMSRGNLSRSRSFRDCPLIEHRQRERSPIMTNEAAMPILGRSFCACHSIYD